MEERIGNVILNLDYYPGEDLYSDGSIEDDLLNTVKTHPEEEYSRIIREKNAWPFLYHLSDIRQNIVRHLNFRGDEKVLEIGSGCGAISPALAAHAGSLTCVDLSKRRSMINAARNQNASNMKIIVGNYETVEPHLPCDYDVITLIGVFEYGGYYISGDHPYETFLNSVLKHLAPHGTLVIAIENRLGFKYFAGYREDHNGQFFSGIEGYEPDSRIRTFSHKEWLNLFSKCGVSHYRFYYPYPDYKFPMYLFSDERLPENHELYAAPQNYDKTRLSLFDNNKVLASLNDNDLFPIVSNSFLIEITKEEKNSPLQYVKYSNERAPEYAVSTSILSDETGKTVIKRGKPAHIEAMKKGQGRLSELYEGSGMKFDLQSAEQETAVFPYAEGISYDRLVDQALKNEGMEAAYKLIDEFLQAAVPTDACGPFETGSEFEFWFGKAEQPQRFSSLPVTDIDLIMRNVICDGDVKHVIDYEWTFDFPVPAEFLKYRILHYYVDDAAGRECFRKDGIFAKYGIDDAMILLFQKMEAQFQKTVRGQTVTMQEFYELMSPGIEDGSVSQELQIYYGDDHGSLSEDRSFVIPIREVRSVYSFELPSGAKALRIDPGANPCRLIVHELRSEKGPLTVHAVHGMAVGDKTWLMGEDPILLVEGDMQGAGRIVADLTIEPVGDAYESLKRSYEEERAKAADKGKNLFGKLRGLKQKLERAIAGTSFPAVAENEEEFSRIEWIRFAQAGGKTFFWLEGQIEQIRHEILTLTPAVQADGTEIQSQVTYLTPRYPRIGLCAGVCRFRVSGVVNGTGIRSFSLAFKETGLKWNGTEEDLARFSVKTRTEISAAAEHVNVRAGGVQVIAWAFASLYYGKQRIAVLPCACRVQNEEGSCIETAEVFQTARRDVAGNLAGDALFSEVMTGYEIILPSDKTAGIQLVFEAEGVRKPVPLPQPEQQAEAEHHPAVSELQTENEPVTVPESVIRSPKISVIVPVYRTPLVYLKEMVDSVRHQTFENWELCIADGSASEEDSERSAYLSSVSETDPRIHVRVLKENKGIAGNTNEALRMAKGAYIALLDHDDLLAETALEEAAAWMDEADMIYTDEDKVNADSTQYFGAHYKPDFNPDLLYSNNYICHLFLVRRSIAEQAGGFRSSYDGSQDYDFILRCFEHSHMIRHIPKILYHWRIHEGSTAGDLRSKLYCRESGRRALEDHCGRMGYRVKVCDTDHLQFYRLAYETEANTCSLILENVQDDLSVCLVRLREVIQRSVSLKEVILYDCDAERETALIDLFERSSLVSVCRLKEEERRDPALAANAVASHAQGRCFLFADTGIRIAETAGPVMDVLSGYFQRSDVGVVGVKSVTDQGRLRGAFLVAGTAEGFSYVYHGANAYEQGITGAVINPRDAAAVDYRLFALSGSLFQQLNGFRSGFAEGAAADFCMRAQACGRHVVYDPSVVIECSESDPLLSSGARDMLAKEWKDVKDPYYNPNYSHRDGMFRLKEDDGHAASEQ